MANKVMKTVDWVEEADEITEQGNFVGDHDMEYFELIIKAEDKFWSVSAVRNDNEGTAYGDGACVYDDRDVNKLVEVFEVKLLTKTISYYG